MGMPISTLPLLAQLLPNLTHLGLYFKENGGMRFSGDLHPQYQFKNFRTLQVGFSSLPGDKIYKRWGQAKMACLSARDTEKGKGYSEDDVFETVGL
ncbi:hypothetical protein FS837_011708 [Tulasnella sp. UAMH 9824]|nr:hypothetical protein FS837_011708 [Tulasnella sp. UAMH 9824]